MQRVIASFGGILVDIADEREGFGPRWKRKGVSRRNVAMCKESKQSATKNGVRNCVFRHNGKSVDLVGLRRKNEGYPGDDLKVLFISGTDPQQPGSKAS